MSVMCFEGVVLMSDPPIRRPRNGVTSLRRFVVTSVSPCCGYVDFIKQTCEQQQDDFLCKHKGRDSLVLVTSLKHII